MKIKYINYMIPECPEFAVGDYMTDLALFALYEQEQKGNCELHISDAGWWLSKEEKEKNPEKFSKLWGKGFTSYGLIRQKELERLNDFKELDYYDRIIISIHHSCANESGLNALKRQIIHQDMGDRFVIIDGHDFDKVDRDLANRVRVYFKRELLPEFGDCCKPISFAFPTNQFRLDRYTRQGTMAFLPYSRFESNKKFDFAPLIPVNQNIDSSYMKTYIYDNEDDYRNMYEDSRFGLTSKKGGWDTMRHYEMMAEGCVPYFVDIENCPPQTLHLFPKKELSEVKSIKGVELNLKPGIWNKFPPIYDNCSCVDIDNPGKITDEFDKEKFEELKEKILSKFRNYLTTEYLGKYILENI